MIMDTKTKPVVEDLLKCPQCGANMELTEESGREKASCPYCGYSRVLERELTPEEKEAHMRALSYEREKGRLKAEAEYEKQKRRRQNRPKYIALAILAAPIIIGLIIGLVNVFLGDPTKPRLDPFEDIAVTFSGADGSGSANIKGRSGVKYRIEDDGELSEGETVTIRAESDEYFLTSKSQKIKVEGLDIYVNDISMLDGEIVAILRERTAAAIASEFDATGEMLSSATKHYESYKWEPIGMDLVSDGERETHIFDVVELTFTRWGETVTRYAVYRFDGVLLHSSGITRVSWSREGFMGPTINIGSMSEGENPVWGTWMGVMEGFESVDEYLNYVRNNYASLKKFQQS